MSYDLLHKPPSTGASGRSIDPTAASYAEPLISARTSLSLLRGAGSNPSSGNPFPASASASAGAAAGNTTSNTSRGGAARSMSPNGRARGELAQNAIAATVCLCCWELFLDAYWLCVCVRYCVNWSDYHCGRVVTVLLLLVKCVRGDILLLCLVLCWR